MDTKERRLNFVERYDWVGWGVLGLIGVMFGVSDMLTGGRTFASGEAVLFEGITGITWDELQVAEPGAARFIDYQERLAGASILFGGLLTIAIAVLGLRRGQRFGMADDVASGAALPRAVAVRALVDRDGPRSWRTGPADRTVDLPDHRRRAALPDLPQVQPVELEGIPLRRSLP
jgi:hypothetical protein